MVKYDFFKTEMDIVNEIVKITDPKYIWGFALLDHNKTII